MTGNKSNREQEERLQAVDGYETRLIEADLQATFGYFGPIVREYCQDAVTNGDHEVWGWTVLGQVLIAKRDLPVDAADMEPDTDRCSGEHRQSILDMMRNAYWVGAQNAGRSA